MILIMRMIVNIEIETPFFFIESTPVQTGGERSARVRRRGRRKPMQTGIFVDRCLGVGVGVADGAGVVTGGWQAAQTPKPPKPLRQV